jgi:hypothetical protein
MFESFPSKQRRLHLWCLLVFPPLDRVCQPLGGHLPGVGVGADTILEI